MIIRPLIIFPVIIPPNHIGDDVDRFDQSPANKAEFYVRPATGSVTYPSGIDLRDFMGAYFIYPIKHHVWQDLPILKYRHAAPQLKAICQKQVVPFFEVSVFRCFTKPGSIMMGDTDMRRARGSLYKRPSCNN